MLTFPILMLWRKYWSKRVQHTLKITGMKKIGMQKKPPGWDYSPENTEKLNRS